MNMVIKDLNSAVKRTTQVKTKNNCSTLLSIILAFLVTNGHLNPQVSKVLCREVCGHLNAGS